MTNNNLVISLKQVDLPSGHVAQHSPGCLVGLLHGVGGQERGMQLTDPC